jgi:hypothetical protein
MVGSKVGMIVGVTDGPKVGTAVGGRKEGAAVGANKNDTANDPSP